ncbi:GNAT family N-acetyltransferase [Brachybacterium sp. 107]|uniref:GNAT family N-acetyltransferase n=1 Tax=Brachybacterium sp. 107 TaxID=3457736 RepID=UPI0040346BC1
MTVPNPVTTLTSTIAIRPAREDDVEHIVALAQAAYRGTGGWTTEAHLVTGTRTDSTEVRDMVADPAVTLLVAVRTPSGTAPSDADPGAEGEQSTAREGEHGTAREGTAEGAEEGIHEDEIVGCCYTRREPADADGLVRAELGLFAVHPSAQSRGLGRSLLTAQSDHLQRDGVDVLMIRVLQSRPELHAWYERHGFVRTGVAVPFAGDPAGLQIAGLGMDVMERPLHEL